MGRLLDESVTVPTNQIIETKNKLYLKGVQYSKKDFTYTPFRSFCDSGDNFELAMNKILAPSNYQPWKVHNGVLVDKDNPKMSYVVNRRSPSYTTYTKDYIMSRYYVMTFDQMIENKTVYPQSFQYNYSYSMMETYISRWLGKARGITYAVVPYINTEKDIGGAYILYTYDNAFSTTPQVAPSYPVNTNYMTYHGGDYNSIKPIGTKPGTEPYNGYDVLFYGYAYGIGSVYIQSFPLGSTAVSSIGSATIPDLKTSTKNMQNYPFSDPIKRADGKYEFFIIGYEDITNADGTYQKTVMVFGKAIFDIDTEETVVKRINTDEIPFHDVYQTVKEYKDFEVFMVGDKKYAVYSMFNTKFYKDRPADEEAIYVFEIDDTDEDNITFTTTQMITKGEFNGSYFGHMFNEKDNTILVYGNKECFMMVFNPGTKQFSIHRLNIPPHVIGMSMEGDFYVLTEKGTTEYVTTSSVQELKIIPPPDDLIYEGNDINTSIKIYSTNYKGDYLAQKVRLTIKGDAKFTDQDAKSIEVTTLTTGELEIPVTIVGAYAISFYADLLL